MEECFKCQRVPDEIIVVNDGGNPNLREMLLSLHRTCPVTYARISEDILWNYNGAVNLGVWLSTGSVIAIEDTDHIPDPGLYVMALRELERQPDVDRIAPRRLVVNINDVMTKPMREWQAVKTWGANQMVTIIRRDMYLKLKGQDERFARNYGYMAMDWANRYRTAGIKSAMATYYWAVIGDEGEPGLKRGMSPENRRFYRENSLYGRTQHPGGILNFMYEYERLGYEKH